MSGLYTIRPLPAEVKAKLRYRARRRSNFSAPWKQTYDLLSRELGMLYAKQVVLMVDCEESDIRIDGELRANARVAPDTALSFSAPGKGDLMFVCGDFTSWNDNVRAIALGLEALRKIERYGITSQAEQYRGWQALPPGTPMPAAKMTVEEAAEFIASHSDDPEGRLVDVRADPSFATALYREAAKRLHPDVGGDAELFRKLTEARDLIEAIQ